MDLKFLKIYKYRWIIATVSVLLTLLLTTMLVSETSSDWPLICFILVFFIDIIIGVFSLGLVFTPEGFVSSPGDIYYDYWKELNRAIDTDNTYKIHELASCDLTLIIKCTDYFVFRSIDMNTMSDEKKEKIFDLMTMYQPDIFTERFKNWVVTDLTKNNTGTYTISEVNSEKGSCKVTVNLKNIAGEKYNYTFSTK